MTHPARSLGTPARLAAGAAFLLAACGPPKPVQVDVVHDGVHVEEATFTCQAPLMARLDTFGHDRPIRIVPATGADNLPALRVEATLEARGFKFIGLTLATGKGAWSNYPPVPPGSELETCQTGARAATTPAAAPPP